MNFGESNLEFGIWNLEFVMTSALGLQKGLVLSRSVKAKPIDRNRNGVNNQCSHGSRTNKFDLLAKCWTTFVLRLRGLGPEIQFGFGFRLG